MNNRENLDHPRSFSYPGTFRDYSRQAVRTSAVFGAVLCAVVLAVFAADRLFYGKSHLTSWHFAGLFILLAGFFLISQFMARSLSRFRIEADGQGLTVTRNGSETRVPFTEISGLDRVRIPGWWPLKADLRPRGETARRMIRIRRGQAPPVTFISGLEHEEELLKIVTESTGSGRKSEDRRTF